MHYLRLGLHCLQARGGGDSEEMNGSKSKRANSTLISHLILVNLVFILLMYWMTSS